jgi:excisionase family DNA binding protein
MTSAEPNSRDSRPKAPPADPPAASTESPQSLPSVLTVDELAALLRLNRKTVYDALARGEIPGARRIGGSYRILREAVIAWLGSGQVRVSRKRQR